MGQLEKASCTSSTSYQASCSARANSKPNLSLTELNNLCKYGRAKEEAT